MKKEVERACEVCGDTYFANAVRLGFGRQTTCSRACSYRLRASKREKGIVVGCAVCGAECRRSPSTIKGKHGATFCSRECHYAGRTLGLSKRIVVEPYRYTVDGKTRIRKASARSYASGSTLPHPEREIYILDRLARAGISAIHQHVIEWDEGAVVVDLYFPPGLVIEIDGPDHRRRDHAAKDQKRDGILAGFGIAVVRIRHRDADSFADTAKAVFRALAYRGGV